MADTLIAKAEERSRGDEFIQVLRLQVRKCKGERLSRSELHMLEFKNRIIKQKMIHPDLQKVQDMVLRKERKLEDAGYVVLYHGQSSEKRFSNMLNTFLDEVQTGRNLNDFYYMHVKENPVRNAQREIDTGSLLTDGIMRDYVRTQVERDEGVRRYKIEGFRGRHGTTAGDFLKGAHFCMNFTLRGNSTSELRQTFPCYFVNNHNEGMGYRQPRSILKDIFDMHYLDWYPLFADELCQLQKEYVGLSRYGTLYQVAIPLESVDNVLSSEYLSVDGQHTNDMKKIVLALQKNSVDSEECNAPMTHHAGGLMDPRSGAKIFAYMIPTDEQKYQAWLAKWEDLKTRMKDHIESQRPADYIPPVHIEELVDLYKEGFKQAQTADA